MTDDKTKECKDFEPFFPPEKSPDLDSGVEPELEITDLWITRILFAVLILILVGLLVIGELAR